MSPFFRMNSVAKDSWMAPEEFEAASKPGQATGR